MPVRFCRRMHVFKTSHDSSRSLESHENESTSLNRLKQWLPCDKTRLSDLQYRHGLAKILSLQRRTKCYSSFSFISSYIRFSISLFSFVFHPPSLPSLSLNLNLNFNLHYTNILIQLPNSRYNTFKFNSLQYITPFHHILNCHDFLRPL